VLDHHPFDVVGWDGYYYPWAFNIRDFEPRVGRIHLPPPFHQTFEGDGFVVCSFCPRPFDFDPAAVPAALQPLERDVRGSDLLRQQRVHEPQGDRVRIHHAPSRRHPPRAPSGPRGGVDRQESGPTSWRSWLDTFRPLTVARRVLPLEDKDYSRSWLDEGGSA
jgi:homogentisate 1,2-dioxygenase